MTVSRSFKAGNNRWYVAQEVTGCFEQTVNSREGVGRAYVAQLLRAQGLEVVEHDLGDKRVNVVARLCGRGGGPGLMLNGHLDTVGVEGMAEPYSAAIRSGRLYGRGSFDMKGSLAVQIALAKALVDAGTQLKGDLILTFVADEEYGSIGTEHIVRHYTADAAIVTEPTGFGLCVAHRGFVWYEVETTGRAAHGSLYREGIDANMRMGRFLAELDKLEQALRARAEHPLVGTPSLHAAQIEGVVFEDSYNARGRTLSLRGTGLLRYMVFIKAYVGAFYVDQNHKTRKAFDDVAKRLELHYFHAIPAADFVKSTTIMIEKNISPRQAERLRPFIDQMNALYKDVQPGDRYAATYIPGIGTELALNGKPLGIVPGFEFANAYLSIWLGKNPIDKGFRDHLLGKK